MDYGEKVGVYGGRELNVMAAIDVGGMRSVSLVGQVISASLTLFVGLRRAGGGGIPRLPR